MSATGSKTRHLVTVAFGGLGVLLQLSGVVGRFQTGLPEADLFLRLLSLLVGTALVMYVTERYAKARGRRDTWALSALLGPLGLILLALLPPLAGPPQPRPGRAPPLRTRSAFDRWTGIVLSVAFGVGLIAAAGAWLRFDPNPPSEDATNLVRNERLAYQRLKTINDAQRRYQERDWDGDGKRSFAAFHVHLWRSVDREGRPIPVNLIPRELGFAMTPGAALDGYLYRSLHSLRVIPTEVRQAFRQRAAGGGDLDPEQEWALAAMPMEHRRTGMLAFIVESSGGIWVEKSGKPWRPSATEASAERGGGWIRIQSPDHLYRIQRGIVYPSSGRSRP